MTTTPSSPNLARTRRLAVVAATTTLALLALTALAWAAAGHAIAGGHYVGKTSQQQTSTIVVSSNARTIAKLTTSVVYDNLCGKQAAASPFTINATNVPITNGSFSVQAQGTAPKAKPLKMIVTGTFIGKTVAGTVAEFNGHCAAPRTVDNPYLATFSLNG